MKVPFLSIKSQYEKIYNEIEPELREIFLNTSFVGGEKVKKFEKDMEDYLGVKHAIGCGSGTAALMLALRACGVKAGDEVITTPFTFFATAEAISAIGAVPVFVDIQKNDYNISPEAVEKAITDKTKAVIPVHIFGAPCNMEAIMKIARKYRLKVVEDAAQAIGSSYFGKKCGSIGDVGCFSFYPTKNLGGAGDGGMVTTNDDEIAVCLEALREHGAGFNGAKALEHLEGITEEIEQKEKVTELYNPYKYYNYLIAYNSRLDSIQAAVLSIKLKYLEDYNERRKEVAGRYSKNLNDKIIKPLYGKDVSPCWHQYVIRSKYKEELCNYLGNNGIGTGSFYPIPLHKQKAFINSECKISGGELPIADLISSETVCLPIFPEITDDQVEYVIETVNRFYEEK